MSPPSSGFSWVFLQSGRRYADHGVHFFRGVTQQALDVTDEPVDVPLACCLQDDVLVIVISQTPRHLLVVHLWLVFT